MSNNNYDIHERIFEFVIVTIKFLNKLPKTPTNLIFINQCTRSITSMGANDQEAEKLIIEGNEIVAIVIAIIIKTQKNGNQRK